MFALSVVCVGNLQAETISFGSVVAERIPHESSDAWARSCYLPAIERRLSEKLTAQGFFIGVRDSENHLTSLPFAVFPEDSNPTTIRTSNLPVRLLFPPRHLSEVRNLLEQLASLSPQRRLLIFYELTASFFRGSPPSPEQEREAAIDKYSLYEIQKITALEKFWREHDEQRLRQGIIYDVHTHSYV